MSDSSPDQIRRSILPLRRVVVVNCYFDYSREPIRRPNKIPQAVGPIYLAGAFEREHCEVRFTRLGKQVEILLNPERVAPVGRNRGAVEWAIQFCNPGLWDI